MIDAISKKIEASMLPRTRCEQYFYDIIISFKNKEAQKD
jgi:hypothetical protein